MARRNAQTDNDEGPAPEYTHVLVRSRRSGFNRSGFRFGPEHTALPLAEIKLKAKAMSTDERPVEPRALLDAILNEPMLDARLITDDEAEQYARAKGAVIAGDFSPTQMYEQLVSQHQAMKEMAAELERVKAQLAKIQGDLPPKHGELPPGSRPSAPQR